MGLILRNTAVSADWGGLFWASLQSEPYYFGVCTRVPVFGNSHIVAIVRIPRHIPLGFLDGSGAFRSARPGGSELTFQSSMSVKLSS